MSDSICDILTSKVCQLQKRLVAQWTSTSWLCTSPDVVCTRLGERASEFCDPCSVISECKANKFRQVHTDVVEIRIQVSFKINPSLVPYNNNNNNAFDILKFSK